VGGLKKQIYYQRINTLYPPRIKFPNIKGIRSSPLLIPASCLPAVQLSPLDRKKFDRAPRPMRASNKFLSIPQFFPSSLSDVCAFPIYSFYKGEEQPDKPFQAQGTN
jgi:hypothetical protein